MPNIKNIIDTHNKKMLNPNQIENIKPCNCADKSKCPLDGECRTQNIIYQATVESSKENQTYIGLTSTEFKARYANHKASFEHKEKRNSTELSKYIWQLKEQNVTFKIKWKTVGQAKPYVNTTNTILMLN